MSQWQHSGWGTLPAVSGLPLENPDLRKGVEGQDVSNRQRDQDRWDETKSTRKHRVGLCIIPNRLVVFILASASARCVLFPGHTLTSHSPNKAST